ncbi:MAG: hypothetical protein LBK66_04150, partial [Spirochaetaceae bacterium]|nr:hypothetical protein [Spirochaetaceae bacterium]
MKLIKLPFLMLVLTAFFACVNELDEEAEEATTTNNTIVDIAMPSTDTYTYAAAVQKVIFPEKPGGTRVVTLANLENNSIYLVKVNTSNVWVSDQNTGKVLNMGVPEDVSAK